MNEISPFITVTIQQGESNGDPVPCSRVYQLLELCNTIPLGVRLRQEVLLLKKHIENTILHRKEFEILEDESQAISGIYDVLRKIGERG